MDREVEGLIVREARARRVPTDVLRSIWLQESSGRGADTPEGSRTSTGRAMGPLQIMPRTARAMGFRGRPEELRDPEVSVPLAVAYFASQLERYGNVPDAVAAYYQGSNRKDKQGRYSGRGPGGHPSAQTYVDSVMSRVNPPPELPEPSLEGPMAADPSTTFTAPRYRWGTRGARMPGMFNVMRRTASRLGHPGGMAQVGEDGPERAQFPGGVAGMVGQFGQTTMDLPQGTQVQPNPMTFMGRRGMARGLMGMARRPSYRYGTKFRYQFGTPGGIFGRNPAPGSQRYTEDMLRGAAGRGLFDPRGSQANLARARRDALGYGRSRAQRLRTLGGLSGLDPMQQQAALVEGEQESATETGRLLGQAGLEESQSARDFFRGMLGQERQFQQQQQLQRQAERAARRAAGGPGAILGQIGGMALPALIPGLGPAIGAAGAMTRNRRQQPPQVYGPSWSQW